MFQYPINIEKTYEALLKEKKQFTFKIIKACSKKPHTCHICGDGINQGDFYAFAQQWVGDKLVKMRECVNCHTEKENGRWAEV